MPGKQLEPRQQISSKEGAMRYFCMRCEGGRDWQRWLRSSQWGKRKTRSVEAGKSGTWEEWYVRSRQCSRHCCGCSLDGVKGKEYKQQHDTKAVLLHIHCVYGDVHQVCLNKAELQYKNNCNSAYVKILSDLANWCEKNGYHSLIILME